MKTKAQRRLRGPSPRALARAVAAIRRDSVASGTDAISMTQSIAKLLLRVRAARARVRKRQLNFERVVSVQEHSR